MRNILNVIIFFLLSTGFPQICLLSAQTVTTSVASSPMAGESPDALRRKETFRIVWQTVNDSHFDPTFNGVNWEAVRAEFEPQVERLQTDQQLHLMLQRMLNRLGQSHFEVIPPEAIPPEVPADSEEINDDEGLKEEKETTDETDLKTELERAKFNMLDHLNSGIGVDLRLINGAAIITRVDPASPAERAGLRPGFELRSINGRRLSVILRLFERAAVFQPVIKNQMPTELVVSLINGAPGTNVNLSYLDALNRPHRVRIQREKLHGEMTAPVQSFPAQFLEFETRRLRGGIGYIRFNLFGMPVLNKVCSALKTMNDAPGVILDLRGNRGGLLGLVYGLSGLLETKPISLGEMIYRGGKFDLRVTPQKHPYRGALVILVDSSSQSAAEMFAEGLQEAGRAEIVGEVSAGATLPSVVKVLPTGAILQYAMADYKTISGKRLEGRGVIPDVSVGLTRRALLRGMDSQLETAIARINNLATNQRAGESDGNAFVEAIGLAASGIRQQIQLSRQKAGVNSKPTSPEVKLILDRYVEAIGGRQALEKLSSRVTAGSYEGNFAGIAISGKFESKEKSPGLSLTLISIPGLGTIRTGYDGAAGYEQVPFSGFREIKGRELERLTISSNFRWALNLQKLYPQLVLKGTEKIGEVETQVIVATPPVGWPTTLYFDSKTGLLIQQDEVSFDDFRVVDGAKIPFVLRSKSATIKLSEVKHNIPLDDELFRPEKDCLSQ